MFNQNPRLTTGDYFSYKKNQKVHDFTMLFHIFVKKFDEYEKDIYNLIEHSYILCLQ